MRLRRASAALLLCLGAALPALAQDTVTQALRSPVLTVDQDALFVGSAFGRASLARLEAASDALLAENRRIEAALEAEERALTERRATLSADDFRTAAAAFDTKVESIRKAQDAKSRDIARISETDRKTFYDAVVPALADIMRESGAAVLLDQTAVVLSLGAVDVTQAGIARIDALLAPDGTRVEPAPPPEPAPEPAPEPSPQGPATTTP